jgi:pimeloyl-ACP methyl ester carboxylesterase
MFATSDNPDHFMATWGMDSVVEPRLEGTFRVATHRRISFAEYGNPHGRVVFWFHGTPGGRTQISPHTHPIAMEMGIRLILLERPGVGFSTPHVYPNVLGFADDVGAIADALGEQRFAVVGLSGGGPYALACAYRFPDRVVAAAVLGGVAPSRGVDAATGGIIGLARRLAPLVELSRRPVGDGLHRLVRVLAPIRSQVFDLYVAISPEGDKRVFRRPEMKQMFIEDILRSLRKQAHALPTDLVLFTRDWGFSLRDIRVPIRFWHGDADNIVPVAHVHHMMKLVPDAELRIRHGESHLGALDASEEIFKTLLELWPVE